MFTKLPLTDTAAFESDDFLVVRAAAIQSYADLEQGTCRLFAHLAGVSDRVAGVIYFKVNNARSRIAILDRLKRLKYGEHFALYYNSLTKEIRRLDGIRNNIVHWSHRFWPGDLKEGEQPALVPPAFWDHDENTPQITADDLRDFGYDCHLYTRAINRLIHEMQGLPDPYGRPNICLEPIPRPLPESHQLYSRRPKREDQPE